MKEIDLLNEAQKELSRIGTVMNEVSARERTYEEKLAGLKKELPDMLTRMALGESVTRSEVDEVKESIRIVKERIDEIPITLEGLEPIRLRAEYKVRDATKQIEKLYQSIKDNLSKGDKSPGLIEDLKSYSSYVGIVEDCEEFVRKIKQTK